MKNNYCLLKAWLLAIIATALVFLSIYLVLAKTKEIMDVPDKPVENKSMNSAIKSADEKDSAEVKVSYRIIHAGAIWCPPCNHVKNSVWPDKRVQKALVDFGFKLEFVDVEKDQGFARRYNIESVPTIIVLGVKDNRLLHRAGFMNIDEVIEYLKFIAGTD